MQGKITTVRCAVGKIMPSKIQSGISQQQSRRFLISKSGRLLLFLMLLSAINTFAQNNYSGANGNWNVPANWSLSHVPTSSETVTIPGNRNVNVDTAAQCASLTLTGGANSNTLTITGTNSLTVGGTITIGAPTGGNIITGARNKVISVGAGTMTCASLVMTDTASGSNTCQVTLSTGTITVTGNITMPGVLTENSLTISGNGTLQIGGAMPSTEGCFSLSPTSTVKYTGSGNQNVYTKGFATVIIPIAADLNYGNLQLTNGGIKTALGNIYVAGSWTNDVTFAPSTFTVGFTGSGTQTIGGAASTTFNNLSILRGDPTTLAADVNVTGTLALGGLDPTLSLTDGQLDISNRILTLTNAVTAGDLSFDNEDMIIASGGGQVRRVFTATGSYTFPVGDNTDTVEYSPVTVNITAGTFSGAYVGVSVTDAKHPDNASTTNFITRYWNVTQTGITGAIATVTGICVAADISGATTAISTGQLPGLFSQTVNPWIKFAGFSGNNFTATGASLVPGVTSAFTGLTKAAPLVSISNSGTTCQNGLVTLTAIPTGDASFLYNWSGGLGNANIASPPTTIAGTVNYSVTATDGNGFTATSNSNVNVNANPTFTAAVQNAVVCENTAATINLSGLLPNSTSTISYQINGGPILNAANVIANPSGNASFNIMLSLEDNGLPLSVTNILRTDVTPTCPVAPAVNSTTLACNEVFTYYADNDHDGFGNFSNTNESCFGAPVDYVSNDEDCDDTVIFYEDSDEDGFGSTTYIPCGSVTNSTDCDDFDATTYPGAIEIGYDVADNDCDGLTDEGFPPITTTLMTVQCGITLPQINSPVYANLVPGAQGYRWRITRMIDGTTPAEVQYLDTLLRAMRITQLGSYAFNTTYKIELAVYYAGHLQPYLESSCMVTTPATTTQLMSCGNDLELLNMNDLVYANLIPFATGYRFKVYDPESPLAFQELERNVREFRMSLITGFQVHYGKQYNVECAIKNTDGTYLPYGNICTVKTPLFPTTSIQESQCDNGIGAPYIVPNYNTLIYATSFPGAIAYAFRLAGPGLPPEGAVVLKSLRAFSLSDFAGAGLIPGATYNASVRLVFNLGDPAGFYGKVCTLTVPGLSKISQDTVSENDWTVAAHPNPFVDGFSLTFDSVTQNNTYIKVYDMAGRLLDEFKLKSPDMEMKIGEAYPSGIYTITVNRENEIKSLRLIKR